MAVFAKGKIEGYVGPTELGAPDHVEYNDENIFVLGSPTADLQPSEGGPCDPAACAEIADFFRAEIDRIVAGGTRFIGAPPH